MKGGADIATAGKPHQCGAIRNKTEASACQEPAKISNAPENSHPLTFCRPSSRIYPPKTMTGICMQLRLLCF